MFLANQLNTVEWLEFTPRCGCLTPAAEIHHFFVFDLTIPMCYFMGRAIVTGPVEMSWCWQVADDTSQNTAFLSNCTINSHLFVNEALFWPQFVPALYLSRTGHHLKSVLWASLSLLLLCLSFTALTVPEIHTLDTFYIMYIFNVLFGWCYFIKTSKPDALCVPCLRWYIDMRCSNKTPIVSRAVTRSARRASAPMSCPVGLIYVSWLTLHWLMLHWKKP